MYRTSEVKDIRLQKIISKEIMNAFDEMFQTMTNDAAVIKESIQNFCEDLDITISSNLELDLLYYKITGMYEELADEEHQYTFDDHGEWILAKLLMYMLQSYEGFLQYAEEEEPEEFKDHAPSIEDFWESSLSEEDIKYVEEFADNYFSGTVNEIFKAEEDPAEYQDWLDFQHAIFIERVTYFPMMAFEITDEMTPEFLFTDRNFLLIDSFGKEQFDQMRDKAEEKNGNIQMYTGSVCFGLNE